MDSLKQPTPFAKAFDTVQEIQAMRSRMGYVCYWRSTNGRPFWRVYYPAAYKAALKEMNSFVDTIVDKTLQKNHAQSGSGKYFFTDALSEFTTDKKVLRDQLVNT